jgi:hypothetical protein
MKPRKGIHRVVHSRSRTKGWSAVIRRASGEVTKLFSDNVHGGRVKAYQAASKWLELTLPLYPLATRIDRMVKVRRNNRSGVPGVYRYPATGEKVVDAYWGCQWVNEPNSKPTRRKFSIACYGERGSKQLAIKARNSAIASLKNDWQITQ